MGEATLDVTGNREIDDLGEATTFRVAALQPDGKVGTGTVEVKSSSGSLTTPVTLELDTYGTSSVMFSCDADLDQGCQGLVEVYFTWFHEGIAVRVTKSVQVGEPPPPPAPMPTWETGVRWPPNDNGGPCGFVTPNAPVVAPRCSATNACQRGFSCRNGRCVLNGTSGQLQVTLRMGEPVDLDLHFYEPAPDAGVCHTYFGNKNVPPTGGCRSSLDLDSNAGCSVDNINTENIVFTEERPRPGSYKTEVDLFSPCMKTNIPYELKVRVGVLTKYYCGRFVLDGGVVERRHEFPNLVIP